MYGNVLACKICIYKRVADGSLGPVHIPISVTTSILKTNLNRIYYYYNIYIYIYKGLWVVYKLLQTLVQICLDIKEKQTLYNITTWMPLWLIFFFILNINFFVESMLNVFFPPPPFPCKYISFYVTWFGNS